MTGNEISRNENEAALLLSLAFLFSRSVSASKKHPTIKHFILRDLIAFARVFTQICFFK